MADKTVKAQILARLLAGEELSPKDFAELLKEEFTEPSVDAPEGQEDELFTEIFEMELERSGILERTRKLAVARRKAYEKERRLAQELYSKVMAAQAEDRLEMIAASEQFHSRAFCALLLEKVREVWFQNPEEARRCGEVALGILEKLDPALYGSQPLEDMKARAHALLGNTWRLAENLTAAHEAFQEADRHLAQGSGDLLVTAEILTLKASLRRAQGKFHESMALLDEAMETYLDSGDAHLAGRTLIKKATLYEHMQEPEKAIAALQQALEWIDPVSDDRLELVARHNLITYLCDCGREEEAETLLLASRELFRLYLEPWARAHLPWLEGKIASGRNRPEQAEVALREARSRFLEEEKTYSAALVSFDLAALYLRQQRTGDLKTLAQEMFEAFSARDIHREAFASLILFRQAAELETVTLSLIQEFALSIRKVQDQPQRPPS